MLRARGGELERDFAYGVVRQLLERAVLGAPEAERNALLDGAAALSAPVLGIGDADDDAGAQPSGPGDDASFAAAHGLYWLVSNLAAQGPLALEVDDAHWADGASLRFLSYLAGRIDGLSVALFVAMRPSEPGADVPLVAALRATPGASLVNPPPLSRAGVATLLSSRLSAQPAPEFVNACHHATAGNPFLLGELVGALDDDRIEPNAAGASAVRALGPETVARALLLRLGRLPGTCTDLASAVAVLGAEADLRQAAAVAELDEAAASKAADALAAVEILAWERPLRFAHPVVREATYDTEDVGGGSLKCVKLTAKTK